MKNTTVTVKNYEESQDQFSVETKDKSRYLINAGDFAEAVDEFDEPQEFLDREFEIPESLLS